MGRVCCWFLPLPERFSSSSQVTNINSHYQIVIYLIFCLLLYFKEQGWRSGESAHLPPVLPRFKSRRRCHMWVEFVVGSLPCSERFFSGYSGFPSPQKPTLPNSNSIWNARTRLNKFIRTLKCFVGKKQFTIF